MTCHTLRRHIVDSRFHRTGYSTEESRMIFCDLRRLQRWLDVEAALATSQATLGIIPLSAAEEISQTSQLNMFDLKEIKSSINSTGHSLAPLLSAWQKATSPESAGYIHFGISPQDIQDTAQSLEIKDVLSIIERDLFLIIKELISLARRTRTLVVVGRSHGQHALPATLGLKFAVWLDEMIRSGERFKECRKRVLVSQLIGGVDTMGAFRCQSLDLLTEFSKRLKLSAPLTAWHTSRDRIAELLSNMAILAGGLGKIANEIWQLARNEICELEEPFYSDRVGPSPGAYKHYPELCEQVVVLSKLIRNQANAAFDGLIDEHERDYRAVRLEWVSIPESSILLCRAMGLMKSILKNLVIHEEHMTDNLGQQTYPASPDSLRREKTDSSGRQRTNLLLYDLVMRAYGANRPLQEMLEEYPDITSQLSAHELAELLEPAKHIGLAPKITEQTIISAEEWLAHHLPGNLSEHICPLADKNGECTISIADGSTT